MNAPTPVLRFARESAGTGITKFFPNQSYHYQTLRVFSDIPYGGGDTGEILEIIRHIRDGDPQSWFAGWSAGGERLERLAERTRDPLSKGRALLRAHNYHRTAEFFLPPDDPKRAQSWERNVRTFYAGLRAAGVRHERFRADYPGGGLQCVYYPVGEAAPSGKPLIVFCGGFDSTLEELYFVLVVAALERGHPVLTYEGPGQGEALRAQGLPFTHEWEKPTSAVLDAFLARHGGAERRWPAPMVLIGMSMGGYFAPRAAAFEPRFDGVCAFDTFYDCGKTAARYAALLDLPAAWANEDFAWAMRNSMWTLGKPDARSAVEAFRDYTLAPVADRIRQHVLILAGEEDHFVDMEQTRDFERALVNARSVTTRVYDRQSGGAEHCQLGALTLWHCDFFDWLADKFE